MTFLRSLTMGVGFILATTSAAEGLQAEELTDTTYKKWREHVLPRTWELAYKEDPLATELLGSCHRGSAKG